MNDDRMFALAEQAIVHLMDAHDVDEIFVDIPFEIVAPRLVFSRAPSRDQIVVRRINRRPENGIVPSVWREHVEKSYAALCGCGDPGDCGDC